MQFQCSLGLCLALVVLSVTALPNLDSCKVSNEKFTIGVNKDETVCMWASPTNCEKLKGGTTKCCKLVENKAREPVECVPTRKAIMQSREEIDNTKAKEVMALGGNTASWGLADPTKEDVASNFGSHLEQLKDRHIDYQLQNDPLDYYTEKVGDMAQRANLSPRAFNWVEIDPERDVLLVIDMQKDFVNTDDLNSPTGCGSEKPCGRFSCPGATKASRVIENLIDQFSSAGATIIASKDYHPRDHASFKRFAMPILGQGEHCVWGTQGSKMYEPLRRKLEEARLRPNSHVDIVFKGMNKDIDSFGAFPYAERHANKRQLEREEHLTKEDNLETFAFNDKVSSGQVDSSNLIWTGSWRVPTCKKDTGNYKREFDEYRYDIDAHPPLNTEDEWKDVVEHPANTLTNVIIEHLNEIRNKQPHDYSMTGCEADPTKTPQLAWKAAPDSLKDGDKKGIRIFVTGVALDFCVIDTTINSLHAFDDVSVESYLVWDAARPVNLFNTGKALFSAYGAILAHEDIGSVDDKHAVQDFLSGLLLSQDNSFAGSPKTVRSLLKEYTKPDGARKNVMRLLRKDQIVSAPDVSSDLVHTPWFNYIDKFGGMTKSDMSIIPYAKDKADTVDRCMYGITHKLFHPQCFCGDCDKGDEMEDYDETKTLDGRMGINHLHRPRSDKWKGDAVAMELRGAPTRRDMDSMLYSEPAGDAYSEDDRMFDPIFRATNAVDQREMLKTLPSSRWRDVVRSARRQGRDAELHPAFQSVFGDDYQYTLGLPDDGDDLGPADRDVELIQREEVIYDYDGATYNPYMDREKGIAAARTRFLLTRYKEMCNHLEATFHECMSRHTGNGIHEQATAVLPDGSLAGYDESAVEKCACPRCYGDLVTRNFDTYRKMMQKENLRDETTAASEILEFYEMALKGRITLPNGKTFDFWGNMFQCLNNYDSTACDELASVMGTLLTPPMPKSVRQMLFWSTPAGKEKATEIARTGDNAYMLEGKTSFGVFFDGLSGHEIRGLFPMSYREKGPWGFEMVSNMWGKAFSKAYGNYVHNLLDVAEADNKCENEVYLDLFVSTFREGSAFHGTELPTVFKAYYERWQKAENNQNADAITNLKSQVKFNIFFDAECDARKFLKNKACKMFVDDNRSKRCLKEEMSEKDQEKKFAGNNAGLAKMTIGEIWDQFKADDGVHLLENKNGFKNIPDVMYNCVEGGDVLKDVWADQYRPILGLNDRFDILNACSNSFKCGSDILDKNYLMKYAASAFKCHCEWDKKDMLEEFKEEIEKDGIDPTECKKLEDMCLRKRLGGPNALKTYYTALKHFTTHVVHYYSGSDSFTTFKADVSRKDIKTTLKYDSQARIQYCNKHRKKMDEGIYIAQSSLEDDGNVSGDKKSVENVEPMRTGTDDTKPEQNDDTKKSSEDAQIIAKKKKEEERKAELEAREIESSPAEETTIEKDGEALLKESARMMDMAEKVGRLRADHGLRGQ